MKVSTIRPGYMVSVRTSIRGNVSYTTTDLGTTTTVDGAEEARWQTDRLMRDKAEQERAVKARSAARSALVSVCVLSDFCMLCPEERRPQLDAAIAKAEAIADEFNASSRLTNLSVNVMVGHVAADDALAIRGINKEMRELIEDMERGIAALDVEAVRKAASKAKSVGRMLETSTQERVQKAVNAAREAAKQIVKAGESAAIEIDQATLARLAEARTQFLDLEEVAPLGEVVGHDVRGVDLDPKQTREEVQAEMREAFGIEMTPDAPVSDIGWDEDATEDGEAEEIKAPAAIAPQFDF